MTGVDERHRWVLPVAGLLSALALLLALFYPLQHEDERPFDRPARQDADAVRSRPTASAPVQVRPETRHEPPPLSLDRLFAAVPPERLEQVRDEIRRGLRLAGEEQAAQALAAALELPAGRLAAGMLLAGGQINEIGVRRLLEACRRLPAAAKLRLVEAFFTATAAKRVVPPYQRGRRVCELLSGLSVQRARSLVLRILNDKAAVEAAGGLDILLAYAGQQGREIAAAVDRLLQRGRVDPGKLTAHIMARWEADPEGAAPLLMQAREHSNPMVRSTARSLLLSDWERDERNYEAYKDAWLEIYPTANPDEQAILACKLADIGHRPAWRWIKGWLDAGDWPRARRCIGFLASYSGGRYSDPLELPPDLRWAVARHWSGWVERHLSTPASGRRRPLPRRW